jgi:23S rRNA pseudoU1915 N3-methylase RlmH
MKWVLAVFGKAGSPFIADEVDKYVKRLRGGVYPLEVVELKESKLDDRLQSLAQEGRAVVVACSGDDVARFTPAETLVFRM